MIPFLTDFIVLLYLLNLSRQNVATDAFKSKSTNTIYYIPNIYYLFKLIKRYILILKQYGLQDLYYRTPRGKISRQIKFQFTLKQSLLILSVIVFKLSALGQFKLFEEKILGNDSINKTYLREKIFVHCDKPSYKTNDTIWLKGYVLTAADNAPNDSIGIAYVEIINDENKVVKRISAPCFWGYFFSKVVLYDNDFKQGTYTLRAYTNWMRNFGDSLFFERRFIVFDPGSAKWRARIKEMNFSGNHFTLLAGLTLPDGQALANCSISLRLSTKRNDFLNLPIRTDASGNFYVDTLVNVAGNSKDLALEITDKKNLRLQVPVVAGNNSFFDLQFLPEGGSFLSGKHQVLGFKALNAHGKGVDVKGVIKDSKGRQAASFSSGFKGMGTVSLTPQVNERYRAFLDNGMSFKLPDPNTSGTVMQIINSPLADSVKLKIDVSSDLYGGSYYLSAEARGTNCMRARIKGITKPYQLTIAKSIFPSGVLRFTLYDERFNPLNERITFIWHEDDLRLAITPNKPFYLKKDSVAITLRAKNSSNENTRGSFSIAIIDTSQVEVAPDAENLLSYMLLSSDLKGEIEEPYYYFKNSGSSALEALMLTQGWVNYNWKMKVPVFAREREFGIAGAVTNTLNKPVSDVNVTLFVREGNNGKFFLNTLTNKEGTFQFRNFPYFISDSVSMVLKVLNKRGKEFGVGVEIDTPNYPQYSGKQLFLPEKTILLDTVARQLVDRHIKIREALKRDGHYLEEVIVKTRRKIPGSKNLNENGGADQTVSNELLEKTPKETLLNVLEKSVTGFRLAPPLGNGSTKWMLQYLVGSSIARFVIDGIDLDDFYYAKNPDLDDPYQKLPSENTPKDDRLLFLQPYLTNFSAEDIIGIEVMKTPKYSTTYRSTYLSITESKDMRVKMDTYAFIEITTRLGTGPFHGKIPGQYAYKPLVPVITKDFYSPKYALPQQETNIRDMRSTIYWNPEVMTDDNGKALISFYTSERSSNYLIILQGMDFRGGLGVLYQYLNVKDEDKAGGK